MFLHLDDGPASRFYILQPGYDPLIENYACGACACTRANGRTEFLPGWRVRQDGAGPRPAASGRSDERLAPCGAGSRGDRRTDAPGAPEAPAPSGRPDAGGSGGRSRWTRWLFVLRHGSRSDRAIDGGERLETRPGLRLEDGASRDGIRPAEGKTLIVPRVRTRS